MKPITVSVDVRQGREEVYDFLDVLGNHEQFTDHFLIDWELSGPERGVGARARIRVKSPGPDDRLQMEVIAAERPSMTMEESVGAKGRRRTRGTYRLDPLPGGGTRIAFELSWLELPWFERLTAPITRAVVKRATAKSLDRLAGALGSRE